MLARRLVSALLLGALGVAVPAWSEPAAPRALATAASDARPAPDLAPESPSALLDRAFANLYGDDFVQVLTLSAWRRGRHSFTRRAQLTRKQSVRPGKALVRFLEPQDIRRTGVLILEHDDRYDDFFVYLPALGKVRRLVSGQRADAFFGTDLCYEDVEPKHVADWDVKLVGPGEQAGTPCLVLDIRPKAGHVSTYERMESCIEPARAVILRTDFFRQGRAVKQLRVELGSVHEVAGRQIPFAFRMETPGQQSWTEVETASYEIRAGLPDQLFTAANLQAGSAEGDRAADAP